MIFDSEKYVNNYYRALQGEMLTKFCIFTRLIPNNMIITLSNTKEFALKRVFTLLFFVIISFCSSEIHAQGATCEVSAPFCSDASGELTFDNVTGVSSIGNIGCLGSTPNPAWYFLRIDQAGDLNFNIVQWVDNNNNNVPDGGEPQLDVDFIAWGPFPTTDSNCTNLARMCDNDGDGNPTDTCPSNPGSNYYFNNDDNTNIIDCSFSGSSVESFRIPNAQDGEFYILLLTNFANAAGKIQLQQTNLGDAGSGETDCSIVVANLPDQDVCGDGPIDIDGTTTDAVSYQWALLNEATMVFEDLPGETNPILTVNVSGTYQLTVEDEDGFSEIEDVVITFFETPIINSAQDLTICELNNNAGIFDLTTNNNPILGTQNPADFTITYHTSLDDAENNNAPITTATNYSSGAAEIFIRLQRNDLVTCIATGSFQLLVNPAPILADTAFNYAICEVLDVTPNESILSFSEMIAGLRDNANQTTDLLDAAEPLTMNNFIITYHTSMADAENNVNPVANNSVIVDGTILFVRVENNQMTNPTGCFNINNIATITIQVSQIPEIITNVPHDVECATSSVTQNTRVFDLTENDSNISPTTNSPDVIVRYYASLEDFNNNNPITPANAYTNISNPQTIIAQVVNPTSQCVSNETVRFDLRINHIPILSETAYTYAICEDMDATPQESNVVFAEMFSNLINNSGDLVPLLANNEPIVLADFNISIHTSSADAMTGMNPIVDGSALTDGTILFVRVENPTTNCFNADNIAEITLSINNKPNAIMVAAPFEVCETEVGSMVGIFDFADYNDEIIGADPVPANYSFTYRLSQNPADVAIINSNAYEGTTGEIIYVWIEDTDTGCISDIGSFSLQVNRLPVVLFPEDGVQCVDVNGQLTLDLGENLGAGFTYDWTPDNDPDGDGVENPVFELRTLTETTTFSVIITDNTTSTMTNCVNEYSAELIPSFPPISVAVTIETDAFTGLFTVTADPEIGLGDIDDYEYQLDAGAFQDSQTFTNVRGGDHVMTVRNRFGCGEQVSSMFELIDYPKYFTPNGDGVHDVWRITNIESQAEAKIYIFDRNGKLLKQLIPGDSGWDGTYNGQNMPSTDYWFKIEYIEPRDNTNRIFTANFTLKR